MNNYKINYGGKVENIEGVNLESALSNHGFTNIKIKPQWRGNSNGEYIAYCSGVTVRCEWIEKKESLNDKS